MTPKEPAQGRGTVVTSDELARRTIKSSDYVSCDQAFIDCWMPGSEAKENYSIIGAGVTQSAAQVVNLTEPHGFNIGAAAMPKGVTNNLHLHFTAEVFINVGGVFRVRWGEGGSSEREYVSVDGDVISVPTWLFRGFTNEGPDDGWLFTVLGGNDTGGIVWHPSIITAAADRGLYLTTDGLIVDTRRGDPQPDPDRVVQPLTDEDLANLRDVGYEEMAERVAPLDTMQWCDQPFLCSDLDGGRARLSAVIGHGSAEDRLVSPRITNPHGFSVAWLQADPDEGMLRNRHDATEVLLVHQGRWVVSFNEGDAAISTEIGPRDTISIPPGAWRSLMAVGDDPGRLLIVNGSDARVRREWADEVVAGARALGTVLDADGYRAPLSVVRWSTADD